MNHDIKKSTRTSKIPQKLLVQPSFFSLKPSTSTSLDNKLSTRLSHILFRQRTTSDMDQQNSQPSKSLDIVIEDYQQGRLPESNASDMSTSTSTPTTTTPSTATTPYSISTPNKNELYSYYYSCNDNNSTSSTAVDNHNITHNRVTIPIMKEEDLSFINILDNNTSTTPLSFSNSFDSLSTTSSTFSNNILTIKNVFVTIQEFTIPLIERCENLLLDIQTNTVTFSHIRDIEFVMNELQSLIYACNEHHELDQADEKMLDIQQNIRNDFFNSFDDIHSNYQDKIKSIIHEIQDICKQCLDLSKNLPNLSTEDIDGFQKELPKVIPKNQSGLELRLDFDLESSTWFRNHFIGKPYKTFIGSLNLLDKSRNSKSFINSILSSTSADEDDQRLGIISVVQEQENDENQYRIIARTKHEQSSHIIRESMIKDTMSKLESKGKSYRLLIDNDDHNKKSTSKHNTWSSLPSSPSSLFLKTDTSKLLSRAAILTACPNINLRFFKELSAESTILSGLEKDLLKYDEIQIPKHYKFGLLTIKDNQTTEEAWFSNTGLSTDLKDFLNIMGSPIQLKGYTGYAAGLDTKTGESGEITYVSKWNNVDITYHVAPLMPSQKHDKQQILRKKHIGNDIVCIIFLEGNQAFNPKAIRSKFLHIYIIVRPETVNSKRCWRVEVIRKNTVKEFGPVLPSPPLFKDDDTLKEFLTLKLINAENAALKSEKFSVPNNKARIELFNSHIQTGLTMINQQKKLLSRPKSIHTNKSLTTSLSSLSSSSSSTTSSRFLKEAISEYTSPNNNTSISPIPYLSRSTLLQDFKKGLVSGSKKLKNSVGGDSRKLKLTLSNGTTTTLLEPVNENDDAGHHSKGSRPKRSFNNSPPTNLIISSTTTTTATSINNNHSTALSWR